MSHFNIIQIAPEKVNKDELIDVGDVCEDGLFLQESDYGGEPLEKEAYERALKSIRRQLSPYASVNIGNRTIRFRKRESVKTQYLKDINKAVRQVKEDFAKGRFSTGEYTLRQNVAELSSEDLFHNGCCMKLGAVIADYLAGYLPQTVHIGAILNAHY